MDKELIFLIVFLALIACFGIGFIIGVFFTISQAELEELEAECEQELENAYCFQCEMEMSTKEKNGNLHCGNCGLRH